MDVKGTTREPEEQEIYYTLINPSTRKAKRDDKM